MTNTYVPEPITNQSAPFEERGRAMIDAIHYDVTEYRLNPESSNDLTGLLIRGLLPELPENMQLHFHEVALSAAIGHDALWELAECGALRASRGVDGSVWFSVREVLDYLIAIGMYGCPDCSHEDCTCGHPQDWAEEAA
jgi:hypothetical protein